MLYFSCLLFFIIFLPVTKKRSQQILFYFIFTFFAVCACLRFGQGTDFFHYFDAYKKISPAFSKKLSVMVAQTGFEPLFVFLMAVVKLLGGSFSFFVALIALFELACFGYAIKRYSNNVLVSAFLFFTGYYLVYVENLLRQGMAMALFFCAVFYYLKTRKLLPFFVFVFLASCFHVSAAIGFFVPLLLKYVPDDILKSRNILVCMLLAFGVGYAMSFVIVHLLVIINPRYIYYKKYFGINIFAVILRTFNMMIALYLFNRNRAAMSRFEVDTLKIYVIGIMLYYVVCSFSILSRLTEYFSLLEVILIPNLLAISKPQTKKMVGSCVVVIFVFLLSKDLVANTYDAGYPSHSLIDYPYISVFNKMDILQYRTTITNAQCYD